LRTRPPARLGARATERRAPQAEWLYGRNAVRESLLAGRRQFRRLLVATGSDDQRRVIEIVSLAERRGVPVERADRDQLDARVRGHHQGVVLEASPYPYVAADDLPRLAQAGSAVLALDGLEDPQNVGSLLRTAEATGVGLVVIPTDRAASITPAVVNASAGAVEHLRIAREVNLVRWLERAKSAGFWSVGLAGREDGASIFETSFTPPLVVVVGSEGSGLRRLVRETCDVLVNIPMRGRIASLNAAVAGSIALYEVVRDTSE
jgi:23S rRNA (guanosine2251-2'-O)-methyltransferase